MKGVDIEPDWGGADTAASLTPSLMVHTKKDFERRGCDRSWLKLPYRPTGVSGDAAALLLRLPLEYLPG
jgi:hypothetical protein